MSVKYDYVKSSVDVAKLDHDIKSSSAIVTDLDYITFNKPSDLSIYFYESLSSEEINTLDTVVSGHDGQPINEYVGDISFYLDSRALSVDQYTTISGEFILMQTLSNRRELHNDSENPLYIPGFTPILGASGTINLLTNRVLNLEEIHDEPGWHSQDVKKASYVKPADILFYYGWLNSFNYTYNSWNNEKVAQDIAKYNIVVVGDGIQNPAHGDYSNTSIIISRIKALNQFCKIFGYVTTNQSISDFKSKVDQWDTLQVYGIFMDESGYDYGTTRSGLNERIDYVHSKTYSSFCFVNAWDVDHIIGTENDESYPNSTYNTQEEESNLTNEDWYLLESFPTSTTYSGGYESKSDWFYRGTRATQNRYDYGINLAAVSTIDNNDVYGQDKFDFSFSSSLIWSLEAHGSSDTNYGSSSSIVKYWTRPKTYWTGRLWDSAPTVTQDTIDNDRYHRYVEFVKITLDFSSGAENSFIVDYGDSYGHVEKFCPGALIEGTPQSPGISTAGPITALSFDDTTNEYMFGSLEIPNTWQRNTDVLVKIRFMNDYSQSGTKVCRWCLDYHVYEDDDYYASKTTTNVCNNFSLSADADADTLFTSEISLSYNDLNNPIGRGKIITFKLYRDAESSSDTMENDANFILLTFLFITEASTYGY